MKDLIAYVASNRNLIELDISLNNLSVRSMVSLVEVLGHDRKLERVNLSYNNLQEITKSPVDEIVILKSKTKRSIKEEMEGDIDEED